jgi:hydroxyacylglutathione hydrolase
MMRATRFFILGPIVVVGSMQFAWAQLPQPDGGNIRAGVLPRQWTTGGPECMESQEWQVHEYNRDLYILRQSGCTDFEKPFVYLLFGEERAQLLDTGSRKGNLVPTRPKGQP